MEEGSPLVVAIPVPTPFPVGDVNVYLTRREPFTLIDAGPLTEDAWSALQAGLLANGLSANDIDRVLLTHGHHDHYGLAMRVADASGATLFGGRPDRNHFRMKRNAKLLLDHMARAGFGLGARFAVVAAVTAVDRFAEPLAAWKELSGGEVLPGDGYSIRVRATPGHTPGSLTYEIPEEELLFTGDTVLKEITPNAVVSDDPERPGEAFRSVSRYFETLSLISETNRHSTLLTGHGKPILDFAAHRDGLKKRYDRRIEGLLAALATGPQNVRELVVRIFPFVRTLNVYLAYSEVLGFLMYLEDRGEVERISGEREDRWRLS